MFNQGSFNIVPFNRLLSVDILGSFQLEASGELFLNANIHISPSFDFEGVGYLSIDAIRDQYASFLLEAIGEMVTEGTIDRVGIFDFEAVGELSFNAGRNRIDIIEFNGEFKPGDRIIIDSNTLKMTLNGDNALHMMMGDFFDLNIGENLLIYTDDQTDRQVLIRVTYRDKCV